MGVARQLALPVSTMVVPTGSGDGMLALSRAPLQAVRTYVAFATCSYDALELASRTSTSTLYVPAAPPVHAKLLAAP